MMMSNSTTIGVWQCRGERRVLLQMANNGMKIALAVGVAAAGVLFVVGIMSKKKDSGAPER